MKILGIDPGSHRVGYAILERGSKRNQIQLVEYNVIDVAAKTPSPENLLEIRQKLGELIGYHKPQYASVEKLFFHKNSKTAGSVYEARGVVLLTLAEEGITIMEPTVTQIKKGITGNGNAQKADVKQALELILRIQLEHKLDDAWDAIAAAFVGNSMV
ncbi:MAG: crossover junction endodeoxyribonuclease RuvC [Spirochaetota bacterium]